jgi:hypothetical protein
MFKSTDLSCILGRRGCGKTYLLRRLISVYPRCIIFDTLHEYTETDGIVVNSYDEFSDFILKNQSTKNFVLIFQFELDIKNELQLFNECLKLLYFRGSVTIVIEEVQNFSNASIWGLQPYFKHCLLTGRHRDLSMIFTTQRAGELHKTILSQCSHIFCGQLHEKNDLLYVCSFLNINVEQIQHLEDRKFIYFQPGEETCCINNDLSGMLNA